jgi:arylsulfatase A-like enzyme
MSSQPNIVFVFADQWRRHALGAMQEDPVITPAFDAFARESVLFENAISGCPVCSPFRASLMTGLYPNHHGVTTNCMPGNGVGLRPTNRSFAWALKDAGYQTAYIGKWHIDAIDQTYPYPSSSWNHFTPPGPRRQGFDYWYSNGCSHSHFDLVYWRDDPEPYIAQGWQADHETDDAIAYLERYDGSAPFALFLSWGPPHSLHDDPARPVTDEEVGWRYDAPERFEALYDASRLERRPNVPDSFARSCLPGYFGAVSALDEAFQRLMHALDQQGLRDDTIVVLSSDHGEMLGSHGMMTKNTYYEESIGIPLLMRFPGRLAPSRTSAITNHVDLMPTILGLAGVPCPAVDGTDLSPHLLSNSDSDVPSSAFIEQARDPSARGEHVGWRGVYTDRYTLVAFPDSRATIIFDRRSDPYQLRALDASDVDSADLAALQEALAACLDRVGEADRPEWAGVCH